MSYRVREDIAFKTASGWHMINRSRAKIEEQIFKFTYVLPVFNA